MKENEAPPNAGSTRYLMSELQHALARIAQLEAALREIRDHPHCSYDVSSVGVADGHRCAANVARAVLADEEER